MFVGCREGDVSAEVERLPRGVEHVPLDLADFASVREFAREVCTNADTLDIVVHSAATLEVWYLGTSMQTGIMRSLKLDTRKTSLAWRGAN